MAKKHRGTWVADQPLVFTTADEIRQAFDRSIPGGFAKLFNRVIDSGAYSTLSVPAQRVYPVLVRLANHDREEQFRFDGSLAQIAKLVGSNKATVVRGLDDLIKAGLLVKLFAGSRRESLAARFQLLLPSLRAAPGSVPERVPGSKMEPAPGSVLAPPPGAKSKPPRGAEAGFERGSEMGPYQADTLKKSSKKGVREALAACGIGEPKLSSLIAGHPEEVLMLKVRDYDFRKGIGERKMPGWLVMSIEQGYPIHEELRARVEREETTQRARVLHERQAQEDRQAAEELRRIEAEVDAVFDETDDAELEILAEQVRGEFGSLRGIHRGTPRTNPSLARLVKAKIARSLHPDAT